MTPPTPHWSPATAALVRAAFVEDLGERGDITSALLAQPAQPVAAALVARQPGIASGLALLPLLCKTFAALQNANIEFVQARTPTTGARPVADGDSLVAGQILGMLAGPHAALLAFERTCLNFLGRMGGVASLTAKFVAAARPARIFDTRKTLPGWRELDKYAVRCGGGFNHRLGLYDAVLIKDNHLADVPIERLSATLTTAIDRLAAKPDFVEVEVDSLAQFDAVCRTPGVNIILIDNFEPAEMIEAVRRRDAAGLRGRIEIEASGGVSLDCVGEVARTGVDRIAVGALTHSAPNLDIGLDR